MIGSREAATPEALQREFKELARRIDVAELDDALYFPRFFQIETTRLCNARCPFCAIDLWDKSEPWMSDALWEKIADELSQYAHWIRFVDLQRAGEPLLDKQLPARIRRLKDGGIRHVMITTNASGLNEVNSRKLLEAGIDEVMLSIDSVIKDNYEKMRVGLKYEQVMDNIRTYFRMRDAINPESMVRVRGVCTFDPADEKNRVEMDAWEGFWRQHTKSHDRVYMKRLHNWGNQVQYEGGSALGGDVHHPCIIPWSTMHITAMGTVALCPHDFDGVANLGNINHQSIAEVWRGMKMTEVRRLHSTGDRDKINFCKGCRTFDEEFSLERDKDRIRNAYKVAGTGPAVAPERLPAE